MEKIISYLIDFYINAGRDTFIEIWGEDMGSHLWRQYNHPYKMNLISFLNYLGKDRKPLINYLEEKYGKFKNRED